MCEKEREDSVRMLYVFDLMDYDKIEFIIKANGQEDIITL